MKRPTASFLGRGVGMGPGRVKEWRADIRVRWWFQSFRTWASVRLQSNRADLSPFRHSPPRSLPGPVKEVATLTNTRENRGGCV